MKHIHAGLLSAALFIPACGFGADLASLTQECDSCHGPSGVSGHSDVPTIAGQKPDFISETLASFQVWGRPCTKSDYRYGDTARPATTMCKIASALDFEQLEALGQHYAGIDFVAAEQAFDPDLASSGAKLHEQQCESCHTDGGAVAGRGPILSGQWTDYLRRAIHESTTGEHMVPPLMERKIVEFSDDEIDALLNFYASRR